MTAIKLIKLLQDLIEENPEAATMEIVMEDALDNIHQIYDAEIIQEDCFSPRIIIS